MRTPLAAAVLAATLAGCSITGTDTRSEFACRAPDGVQCMTASGVYYNSLANNLPALQTSHSEATIRETPANTLLVSSAPRRTQPAEHSEAAASVSVGQRALETPPAGALRAAPRLMRIWMAPWEDADGDLHDQAYLYITLDAGRWLIDHTRATGQTRPVSGTTLLPGELPLQQRPDADGNSSFSKELQKLQLQDESPNSNRRSLP